jgi:gamma-glutamyltranspeptidase/glutathione hydrolase
MKHSASLRFLIGALALLVAAPLARADDTIAKKHMIAAANPLASEAGREMLRAGGSAVDAAIAAQMVLTLVEPESSGIGGGAFMMLWDPATKTVTSFNGRETAPASATPQMFLDANGRPRPKGEVIPGGLSVGVPGVIAMLDMAHKKYGKLPWARLFDPAIKLATDGFALKSKLANAIAGSRTAAMPDLKKYFYKADGTPYREGEILKNPELAATLRLIAQGGAKAFYTGDIANSIVQAVQHQPAPLNQGGMTLADLQNYKATEVKPVCGPYRTYRVCAMGLPSSGGISVVQILGMLERFPSSQLQPGTLSGVHLFTQATRLAYADRAKYLGDTDFVEVPLAGLLDSGYIKQRSMLIDPARDMGTAEAGTPPMKRTDYAPDIEEKIPGTSHLSVVDDKGMVISMTTTVEGSLGAQIMAKGFILNNQLTDFSFEPERNGVKVANAPAPGKRPLSSMSPAIVFDANGNFRYAVGSIGGTAIILHVSEALVGMIDGKLTPQQAADFGHYGNQNGVTSLERGTSVESLAPQLTAMGHTVRVSPMESGQHFIEKVDGGYRGGADPRRDGIALGD